MALYVPDQSSYSKMKDCVVVISGGATGIGAATVKLLSESSAKVVIGDVNVEAAEALCKEYPGVSFVHTDVTKYEDIYNLLQRAYDDHGRIDHAVACAGIFGGYKHVLENTANALSHPEVGNWFDPKLSIDTVKEDSGNLATLNVNVIGTLHFARIAAVFLRENRSKDQDRSLVILSSVNAFRESPGLYIYQTGKHAVHGLLRSSRKILYERDAIRVNAVCPGVTDTPMTGSIISAFRDAGLFWQPPSAVAKVIVGIQADTKIVGKAFYIEGDGSWEFEDSFYHTQPQWLGEEATRRMRVNSEAVQKGVLTPKD